MMDQYQIVYTEMYVAVYKRKDRIIEFFKYKGYRPPYLDLPESLMQGDQSN